MEDMEDEAITIDDIDEENRSSLDFEEIKEDQQQVSPEPKQETVSSELLLKIAEELSSIRKELSILKSVFYQSGRTERGFRVRSGRRRRGGIFRQRRR